MKFLFGMIAIALGLTSVAHAQDIETRVKGLEARVALLEKGGGGVGGVSCSGTYKTCEGSCGSFQFIIVLKSASDGRVIDRITRSFGNYSECTAEYNANCFKLP